VADHPQPDTAELPEKNASGSLGVRAAAAAAFSFVGSKIGYPFMIVDANNVFKGESLSLQEKISSPFNGKFSKALKNRLSEGHNPLSLLKWSLIAGTVGTVGGAILGWVRGGLIENPKDIYKHPLTAMKVVLGLESPSALKQTSTQNTEANITSKDTAADASVTSESTEKNAWSERVKAVQQHDAATQTSLSV
jgi:hypothetical protein